MFDLYGPYESWVGIVTAVGVLVAVVAFALARGAGERGRNVVSGAGAVLLLLATADALNGVRALVTGVSMQGFDTDGGRRFTDLVLLLVGLVAGVVAVFVARSTLASPAYDPDPDDLPDLDVADDGGDGDDVDVPGWPAAYELVAVALALALPALSAARLGLGSQFAFVSDGGDLTAEAALVHLLTGVLAGGALLAFVRRGVPGQALAASFGLLLVGAIVLPIWPETFVNEFWTSFATGLAAGLMLAVALPALVAAIPADRTDALYGALAALVLVTGIGAVVGRVNAAYVEDSFGRFQDQFQDRFDDDDPDDDGIVGELPGDIFPTELLPSGFTYPP